MAASTTAGTPTSAGTPAPAPSDAGAKLRQAALDAIQGKIGKKDSDDAAAAAKKKEEEAKKKQEEEEEGSFQKGTKSNSIRINSETNIDEKSIEKSMALEIHIRKFLIDFVRMGD